MSSAGQFAKQAANVYDEASDGAFVERSVIAGELIKFYFRGCIFWSKIGAIAAQLFSFYALMPQHSSDVFQGQANCYILVLTKSKLLSHYCCPITGTRQQLCYSCARHF